MMDRTSDKLWVWIGSLLGLGYIFKIVQIPDVGLDVLSIFFGGLLAVASILPSIQNFEHIKFIKSSGHINDLVAYIKLPLYLSFFLIVSEVSQRLIIIPHYEYRIISLFLYFITVLILSVWGVFLCSLFRLILIIPKIITDKKLETKS